ncbi:hypothetical protein IJH02_03515 [Candidatus Saccharibacteria bacterium]|nr:hypothetical protein [Candidatus Saccharibacteria bacterium]
MISPELLEKANHHARMSCTRWNKKSGRLGKLSRRHHRNKYRRCAMRTFASPEHQKLVRKYYNQGDYEINTYPWPYCDSGFADWPESDDADDYSLISDQSGFIVRYATSYVAYKIFEYTGAWPQREVRKRYDAWNWIEFLEQAGYDEPAYYCPINGERYVGILKKTDYFEKLYEWGIVVWFEQVSHGGTKVKVTTYLDKKFQILTVNPWNYAWVKISASIRF